MVSGDCYKSTERGKNICDCRNQMGKKCLREGDREVSQDKLMRSKWNSNEQEQGMW